MQAKGLDRTRAKGWSAGALLGWVGRPRPGDSLVGAGLLVGPLSGLWVSGTTPLLRLSSDAMLCRGRVVTLSACFGQTDHIDV